jgi:hypothetical protein
MRTRDERGRRYTPSRSRTWILPFAQRLQCAEPIMTDIGLFDAIYSARALRRLKPDPVPDDLIARILDAAIRASTSPVQGECPARAL